VGVDRGKLTEMRSKKKVIWCQTCKFPLDLMINTGFHAKNSSFSKFCPKKVGGNNSWWEGAGEGFASRFYAPISTVLCSIA
jgi:hypothetical protein